MALEELGVRPGDFVTYYARARDVGQGRRTTEARSDIYFLEVKPFEEVFTAAQSQAMGMQGDPELQDLAEAQKQIIAATWKLDARARRARDARSAADIKAVADAQRELRERASESAGDLAAAMADPRRRRPRPGQTQLPGGDDPLARAVEAMGRATGELDRLSTSDALPHEMTALEQLLKADSDVKERQVARQQQGGGGGGNRPTPDLSTLFDQQLRQQQATNYETPDAAETREESKPDDDPLDRIRELARRQEALQRAQQDLARNRERLAEEEIRRQLERLTREQQQLTEQANALSQELQQQQQARSQPSDEQRSQQDRNGASQAGQQSSGQSSGQASGQSSGQQASNGRQLREIAEQMRGAASELRREDPDQASARSGQAAEQLRELSRQMERARPDERRRLTGDLQYEARQLADAERRLAAEADRAQPGAAGEQARRRLAGEQERLAGRTEQLQDAARQLGGSAGAGNEQAALGEAAREAAEAISRERLAERMRASADALREKGAEGQAAQGRELARALDRIAGDLGDAAGTADAETTRLSDELARASELRDRIGELQRSIDALEQEARQGQPGGRPGSDADRQPGQPGQDPNASPGQGQQAGQPGDPSRSSQSGQQGQPSGTQGGAQPGGDQGGTAAGRAERLARLQRDAQSQMAEAQRLAGEMRQQNPEMRGGASTPEDWYPSLSAPGTEPFKQDFSRWESLKQNLLAAIERAETRLAGQLRERETRERLNAGGHQGVSETYREMVDRYYESLAVPRKPR
ncbi:MAG: hypothetical protein R2712_25040 [Vicinamibacterales bacterium]